MKELFKFDRTEACEESVLFYLRDQIIALLPKDATLEEVEEMLYDDPDATIH